MKTLAIALFILAFGAALAVAEVLDPSLCIVDIPDGADGASVFVTPDGDGLPFTNAYLPGGTVVDATVTVTLVTNFGNPVAYYPAEDLWIGSELDGLVLCAQAGTADAATDVNGQTTWTPSPAAGGNSDGEALVIYLAGVTLSDTADLIFKSSDMNGDLTVNLSDITLFTQALTANDAAGDFNCDGIVDLSDITRFVPSIGAVCP